MKKIKAIIQFLNILGLQKEASKLEPSAIMAIMMHIVEIISLLVTMFADGKVLEAENLADDIKQSLRNRIEPTTADTTKPTTATNEKNSNHAKLV